MYLTKYLLVKFLAILTSSCLQAQRAAYETAVHMPRRTAQPQLLRLLTTHNFTTSRTCKCAIWKLTLSYADSQLSTRFSHFQVQVFKIQHKNHTFIFKSELWIGGNSIRPRFWMNAVPSSVGFVTNHIRIVVLSSCCYWPGGEALGA